MSFELEGTLSLWIGHFESQDELFEYVDFVYDEDGDASCPFATDAGIRWFDHDFQEAHYSEAGLSDAANVLSRHSWSSSFVAGAERALEHASTSQDNAVFILYDFAYDPVRARPRPGGRLRFVGTFLFDKNAPTTAELRENSSV